MKGKQITFRHWVVGIGILLMGGLTTYVMVLPWLMGPNTEINKIYGRHKSRARTSVNGTSVFAKMFQRRGSRVTTWMQLSPRLQRSDTIVWVPNSFELPTADQAEYLEDQWLATDDGRFRTLIYVARDYDAAIEYWQAIGDSASGSDYLESRSRLARTQADHAYARSLTGVEMKCDWFSIENHQRFTKIHATKGPWSQDLEIAKTNISVAGRMILPEAEGSRKTEVLLGAPETPLIVRITDEYAWPDGQIVVLLNGSSVLNLPLVNHENRKVAARLIDACEDPYRVTFLESDASGIRISNHDPNSYSGFEALTVWPINVILLHLVVAGILFCVMVFPIFGRPRRIVEDVPNQFGKHVRAMGQLLSLSGDREAAINKVQQYRNLRSDVAASESPFVRQEAGNPFEA